MSNVNDFIEHIISLTTIFHLQVLCTCTAHPLGKQKKRTSFMVHSIFVEKRGIKTNYIFECVHTTILHIPIFWLPHRPVHTWCCQEMAEPSSCSNHHFICNMPFFYVFILTHWDHKICSCLGFICIFSSKL